MIFPTKPVLPQCLTVTITAPSAALAKKKVCVVSDSTLALPLRPVNVLCPGHPPGPLCSLSLAGPPPGYGQLSPGFVVVIAGSTHSCPVPSPITSSSCSPGFKALEQLLGSNINPKGAWICSRVYVIWPFLVLPQVTLLSYHIPAMLAFSSSNSCSLRPHLPRPLPGRLRSPSNPPSLLTPDILH